MPRPRDDAVAFVALAGGALAIGHRPRVKALLAMKNAGLTHVVTLLAESEGARAVGQAVTGAGLEWIWIPLTGADPPTTDDDGRLREGFEQIRHILNGGARVFVHCSAGIHRTGMFAYGLLRHLGLNRDCARNILAQLRQLTVDGVGDARLAWGDRITDS